MSRKRVLVCGATGFIGRNIVEQFAQRGDYEVVAVWNRRPRFEHPGVRWLQADLTDAADVERALEGADVVVQAAATTSGSKDIVTRPYIHVTDNAVMNALIFRAAFEKRVGHVLFFSCSVMYHASETPLAETDYDPMRELHPRYFGVGWTKLYNERMCQFYAGIGDTRYTAIRHSNVYGPHDKFDLERSHVFGATVTKVLTARDGKVTVWGTGEESRDILYIDDLVAFCAAAIDRQSAPFELFNAGAGQAVTIRDLVQRIVAASGRDLKIEHDLSQPTIKTGFALDCGKARRLLGWQPRVGLDEGIARTIAWWRDHVGGEAGEPAAAD